MGKGGILSTLGVIACTVRKNTLGILHKHRGTVRVRVRDAHWGTVRVRVMDAHWGTVRVRVRVRDAHWGYCINADPIPNGGVWGVSYS